MIYSPLPKSDYLSSANIKTTFDYGKPGHGSGFFVRAFDKHLFITARHLIDDAHLPPQKRQRTMRSSGKISAWSSNPRTGKAAIVEINLKKEDVFQVCPDENDLAALQIGDLDDSVTAEILKNTLHYQISDLCDAQQLQEYSPGEPIFICGYPEGSPQYGPDGIQIPFIRQGIFATLPSVPLCREGELGNDYSYVDCYALGGFSGCAVVAPQIGLPPNSPIEFLPYRPRRVVGMIVRRSETNEDGVAGKHAGLSSFVTTRSIRKLIETSFS